MGAGECSGVSYCRKSLIIASVTLTERTGKGNGKGETKGEKGKRKRGTRKGKGKWMGENPRLGLVNSFGGIPEGVTFTPKIACKVPCTVADVASRVAAKTCL